MKKIVVLFAQLLVRFAVRLAALRDADVRSPVGVRCARVHGFLRHLAAHGGQLELIARDARVGVARLLEVEVSEVGHVLVGKVVGAGLRLLAAAVVVAVGAVGARALDRLQQRAAPVLDVVACVLYTSDAGDE